MKRIAFTFTILGVAGVAAFTAMAQPPGGGRGQGGRGPGGPDGFRPPPHPIEKALDADDDHVISASEIENAAAALKKLDKNSDGKISEEEMRPQFGGRPGGAEGGGRGFGPPEGREGGGRGPGGDRPSRDGDAGRDPGRGAGEMLSRVMAFDKNQDGKLSKDELPERLHGMLTRGDLNDDGSLDKDELSKIAAAFQGRGGDGGGRPPQGRPSGQGPEGRGGPPSAEMMINHAMTFDADGDGKLSRAELTKFAEDVGRRRGGEGGPGGRGGDRPPQGGRGDRGGERPRRPASE